jgi:hypothetical protein
MTIAVCLEDVLSDASHRYELRNESYEAYQAAVSEDEPNLKLIDFLKKINDEIVVYSTTPDNLRPAVLQWLMDQDLEVEHLILKKKSDYRTDQEIKIEMIKSLDKRCKHVIENSMKVAEALRADGYLVIQV